MDSLLLVIFALHKPIDVFFVSVKDKKEHNKGHKEDFKGIGKQ